MNRKISILTICGAIAFGQWISAIADNSVAQAAESCTFIGRIGRVNGQVQLQRRGRSNFQFVSAGTQLCLGDLVRPTSGSRVTIQCNDKQQTWNVPANTISGVTNGCPKPEKPINTPSGVINPPRSDIASKIPHIISPRNTFLLNNKLTIRWQPVSEATSYTVSVVGAGVKWQTQVSTTAVVYAGKIPLKWTAEGYLVKVEADNGEKPGEATFNILKEDQVKLVETATERILKQDLPDDAKALAIADLYIGHFTLIAEAFTPLEAAAKESTTAAVYSLLGNLYAQVEFYLLAEKQYIQAWELAKQADDIEAQAEAAENLGRINLWYKNGNTDLALKWLKQAEEGYTILADREKVQELQELQQQLEKNQ